MSALRKDELLGMTSEELDALLNDIYEVKHIKKREEVESLMNELDTIINKIYDKGYTIYYDEEVIIDSNSLSLA